MSDVDLATLHKCRLEQRIKYQLSRAGWINRNGSNSAFEDEKKAVHNVNNYENKKNQPINGGSSSATNHREQPTPESVIDPCDCCCKFCDCDNANEMVNNDADDSQCTCQGSTTTRAGKVVIASAYGDKKVMCRRKDKRAVISCDHHRDEIDKRGRNKEDVYLTRRRSGTWP